MWLPRAMILPYAAMGGASRVILGLFFEVLGLRERVWGWGFEGPGEHFQGFVVLGNGWSFWG